MDYSTVQSLFAADNIYEKIAILLRQGLAQRKIIDILDVSPKTVIKRLKRKELYQDSQRARRAKNITELITVKVEETISRST
jgi:transposase